jgi:hypothetical protein
LFSNDVLFLLFRNPKVLFEEKTVAGATRHVT